MKKVIARIPGEFEEFGRIVRNATIIKLEPVLHEENQYIIPSFLVNIPGRKIMVEVEESGGATTNGGFATIIAGMNGERMKPLIEYKSGHLSNTVHAMFSMEKCFEVSSDRSGKITIKFIGTEIDEIQTDIVYLIEREMWSGFISEIPFKYEKLTDAAMVAETKANTYHCREAMYIEKKG